MLRTLRQPTRFILATLALAALYSRFASAGLNASDTVAAQGDAPPIEARRKPVLQDAAGLRFKDSNGSGAVEPYEDWRLSAEERAKDLVGRMTLEEKAGMMLIDTLSAPGAPNALASTEAARFVGDEKMTRFIFRNAVTTGTPAAPPVASGASGAPPPPGGGAFAAAPVSPRQAAEFTNAVQELAEATRLGIPVVFKSNARNHYERQARQGINEAAGAFSEWPKEAGLAATRDMALIRGFAETMGAEWRAIGLRGMYGYMADLSTEPRWYRVHETFTEDADLCAEIMKVLVKGLQGAAVTRNTNVALTIKHFPGGGPQEWGLDPHFTFGKTQVYPEGRFEAHMKPFKAAIDAGASAIMPYYGVPKGARFAGWAFDPVGLAFSKMVVSDLLRGRLGFKGYVNSDTGIITQRAWGLESKTVPERVAAAINAGVDVLSGFNKKQTIIDLVKGGLVSESRVNEAVTRLLVEQFNLGLFENPYVDAAAADGIVGKREFRERALEAQRRSLVLLKNAGDNALPLRAPSAAKPVRLYTMGLDAAVVASAAYGGYQVSAGDRTAGNGNARVPVPPGTDYAIFRVEVTNPRQVTGTYRSRDEATGGRINPHTNRPWGSDDPDNIDDRLNFGGSLPWENDMLAFSQMATSQSWQVSPSLEDMRAAMREIGDSRKVVLCIYFRQAYVLDEASGLKNAGAILAAFGVSDAALMDVLTGRSNPQGKLPFALANKPEAIVTQASDAPGYAEADTLFPFGFGLSYPKAPLASAAAPTSAAPRQPRIGVRTAPEITVESLRFKDLNRNGRLDPYEDWRLPAAARVADLVAKMTLQEKGGVMQHGTAPQPGGGFGGAPGGARAYDLTAAQTLIGKGVNSLITRLSADPAVFADQNNQLQAIAEASRLGIPLTISTDPRNQFQAMTGASESAGKFSQWPETLGLSAIGDPAVTRRMADTARKEYRAVGIHMALSPVADLATEPRWARVTGTFGEDADQVSRQVGAYVAGFQGGTAGLQPDGVIAVVKHWAGYGAAKDGWDSHNFYGRYARISEAGLKNHMNAFKGAFAANVSGVMPTYSILQDAGLDGAPLEQVGAGFSRQMLQDQLRGRYGFKGFVVSDWGITSDCPETCLNGAKPPARPAIGMPWGVENLSQSERAAKAVNAGVDQIGGSNDPAPLIEAIGNGKVTTARIDEAVGRVLTVKFDLGLFENPYVDKDAASAVVGSQAFQAAADEAQRRSLVLLQNKDRTLPLKAGAKVFLQGLSADTARTRGLVVAASIEEADVVLMRMSAPFSNLHPDFFFGGRQHEGDLDFKDGQPAFDALKSASSRKPVVAVVSLDRPAILTNVAPLAAGLVADFGVSDAALLDVLVGKSRPSGKLPFELPSSMEAVRAQAEERPHDSANPLFAFGFGLRY